MVQGAGKSKHLGRHLNDRGVLKIPILYHAFRYPWRHDDCRYSQPKPVECKLGGMKACGVVGIWRILAIGVRCRSGRDVFEEAAVLIVG